MKNIADFPSREPSPTDTVTLSLSAAQLILLVQVFDKVAITGRADVKTWASLIETTEAALGRLREDIRGS